MRLEQNVLDGLCRLAGGGKADRQANADDVVYAAVGFLERHRDVWTVADNFRQIRVGVTDLAFDRRNVALAHPGQTLSEWIGGHCSVFPLGVAPSLARGTNL